MTKEQFKAVRIKLGESQPAFARRLGYKTYITILKKEKGERAITFQDELILKHQMETLRKNKKSA